MKITDEDHKLVQRTAKRIAGTMQADYDDLCQAGYIALWQSSGKLPEDETHARAYKALRVRGAMIDQLRKESWTPRSAFKDEDKHLIFSIDARDGDGDDGPRWEDGSDAESEDNSDERLIIRNQKRAIEKVLSGLNEREKQIIELIVEEGIPLNEIANIQEMSASRVSQIVNAIILKFDDHYSINRESANTHVEIIKQEVKPIIEARKSSSSKKPKRKIWNYETGGWAT